MEIKTKFLKSTDLNFSYLFCLMCFSSEYTAGSCRCYHLLTLTPPLYAVSTLCQALH